VLRPHLARTIRSLLLPCIAVGSLSGCCSYFYYDCAPQQPAFYSAYYAAGSFESGRDAAAGLLLSARDVFNDATASEIASRYAAAATAANGWEDYASGALRSGGALSEGESARRLDTIDASMRAFADDVQAAAADPSKLRAPFVQLPQNAQLDATSPIAAAAERAANEVSVAIATIKGVRAPLAQLDAQTRSDVADVIAGARWDTP
jgi:hypothetical protein